MKQFEVFNLSACLLTSLVKMGYETPTPIQAAAIPLALAGHDILGSAQTGTGKTAAFCIPMIEKLLQAEAAFKAHAEDKFSEQKEEVSDVTDETDQEIKTLEINAEGDAEFSAVSAELSSVDQKRSKPKKPSSGLKKALILVPTRELAVQVMEVVRQLLGPKSNLKAALLIGGDPMFKQFAQLNAKPRIIVGTPGRINDHLARGTLNLSDAGFLVLDETDRMLDMGFGIQINEILKYVPNKRQTLLFSATLPKEIVRLSSQYLTNPERVSMGATNVLSQNITQEVIKIEQDKKYAELLTQLEARSGSVILFMKTKHSAEKMAKNLNRDDHKSDALHGDLRQNKRTKVMHNFRQQKFRILVATDIASRGLDVPHIEHVINYDLPQVAEDFVHRLGRTARAGAEGSSLSFVSAQDRGKWREIERLLDPTLKDEPRSAGGNSRGGNGGRSSRPQSGRGGFGAPRGDRSFGDRKPSGFGAPRGDRPFGDRKPSGFGGDRKFGGDRSEGRSFAPRGDRPFGDKKPGGFGGDRKFGDRAEGRSFAPRGDRPFGDKKPGGFGGDRKFGGDRSEGRSFAPRGDRPFAPRGDRPFGDRPARSGEGRPFTPRGDAPRSDRKFGGDRSEGRSFAPRGDRPFGDRKPSSFGGGDRKFGGDRSEGRSFAPRGDRPFGDRPARSGEGRPFTPRGDAPRGDRSFGDRKFGDKKPGGFGGGDRKFGPRPEGRSFGGEGRSEGRKFEGAARSPVGKKFANTNKSDFGSSPKSGGTKFAGKAKVKDLIA